MKTATNNPFTNTLGPGVLEKDVADAVAKSGYPLQTIVAELLRKDFGVQEEWIYIDRDTKELRAADLLASKELYDFRKGQPRVRPHLNFLIECKQSNLPYIFFLSRAQPWPQGFPMLAGLAKDEIVITSDDDPSTWTLSVLHALGLDMHPFMTQPAFSSILSKCARKGSELELSGNDSYNGLVLPLVKALRYFQIAQAPPSTAVYFDAHLTIGLAVLDAPMIGVQVTKDSNELISLPWIRVLRREAVEATHKFDRSRLFVLDVVHKDFLMEYVSTHVMPLAAEFARLAMKHADVLAAGQGFVSRMGTASCNQIEQRLQRKTAGARVKRAAASGRNIMRAITQK